MDNKKTKKALIAIDEPSLAKTIVKTVCNSIDKELYSLSLLNVLETTLAEEELFLRHPDKFIEQESKKNQYDELIEHITTQGFEFDGFIFKEGNASKHINKTAKENDFDLIVLGSGNKNIFEKILIGSTSYKVAREAKGSILIVKPAQEVCIKEKIKVIVATDGSECSIYMISELCNYLNPDKTEIIIIYIKPPIESVIPHDVYSYIDISLIRKESAVIADKILHNAEQILTQQGFIVSDKLQIEGYPALEIIEQSNQHNADLIVLGGHCQSDAKGIFPGSVGIKVFENSNKPVLIVKK